jgi:hypothetical protein
MAEVAKEIKSGGYRVNVKKAVFWDVMPRGSYKNQRFEGT